jgi:hypothetical protein
MIRITRVGGGIGRPVVMGVMILLTVETLAVVTLLSMGRLGAIDAILFAVVPWGLAAAAFRPDWLLLVLIAAPASVTAIIQTKEALLLPAVALTALMLTRRRFSVGLRTGIGALIIVILAGHVFHANVAPNAIAVSQGVMWHLTYYVVLSLLAFNLTVSEDVDGERIATAVVIGVMSTALVGLAGYGNAWFPSGSAVLTRTYLGPLAAAALGVSFARFLTAREVGDRRLAHLALSGGLVLLTLVSSVRAAWIAGAITLALIALRSGRRGYVLILAGATVLALLTPTVRQQVSRSESGDVVAELRTGEITTGRWALWTGLWDRAEPALPWGNGFGYIWSLSSEDLVGVPGQYGTDEGGVVPPHNDFMYLLVEFGVPGVILLLLFWIRLFKAEDVVAQSRNARLRRSGLLLVGMLVAGLMVALVDDVLLVRPIAERFFPVAGCVFGLAQIERARTPHTWHWSRRGRAGVAEVAPLPP